MNKRLGDAMSNHLLNRKGGAGRAALEHPRPGQRPISANLLFNETLNAAESDGPTVLGNLLSPVLRQLDHLQASTNKLALMRRCPPLTRGGRAPNSASTGSEFRVSHGMRLPVLAYDHAPDSHCQGAQKSQTGDTDDDTCFFVERHCFA
jgi:hypothetical protein